MIFYFFEEKHSELKELKNKNNCLDLRKFHTITEKERLILKDIILTNDKLETIEKKYRISHKSLRNTLSRLYKIINEGDRLTLTGKYSNS